ncbi:MAG: short-chain dehydrogenase [Chitinophagaceae bacterium]|nr:short-chain dehydrogenase [Chitinophagaceae bacterium]
MLPEQIAKFIENEQLNNPSVKIEFKKRNTIIGLFVKLNDYEELKNKNFWRLVTETNLEQWHKTNDINEAKLFNGSEFTRLSVIKKKAV